MIALDTKWSRKVKLNVRHGVTHVNRHVGEEWRTAIIKFSFSHKCLNEVYLHLASQFAFKFGNKVLTRCNR